MYDRLTKAYEQILKGVGEQQQRDGLRDTPQRAAKAMLFLTSGYDQDLEKVVNGALFDSENKEMVVVRDMDLFSLCEHHMLPFVGHCHIAYLPNGKVLGLSKFARIANMYARRLQIQENLTQQIAQAVEKVTGARGVGVVIEAKHLCMMMRGVEKQNAMTSTSVMLGALQENAMLRGEFFSMLRSGSG